MYRSSKIDFPLTLKQRAVLLVKFTRQLRRLSSLTYFRVTSFELFLISLGLVMCGCDRHSVVNISPVSATIEESVARNVFARELVPISNDNLTVGERVRFTSFWLERIERSSKHPMGVGVHGTRVCIAFIPLDDVNPFRLARSLRFEVLNIDGVSVDFTKSIYANSSVNVIGLAFQKDPKSVDPTIIRVKVAADSEIPELVIKLEARGPGVEKANDKWDANKWIDQMGQ